MFSVNRREEEGIAVVNLVGVLDHTGTRDLTFYLQEMKNHHFDKILFNFSQLSAVMYTSLQEVITPFRELLARSRVALCGMSPNVHKVIKTAPFYSKVQVYETEEEALEDF